MHIPTHWPEEKQFFLDRYIQAEEENPPMTHNPQENHPALALARATPENHVNIRRYASSRPGDPNVDAIK